MRYMYTAMVVIVFSKKVKSTSEDEVIIDKKSAQETRATPRYACLVLPFLPLDARVNVTL